MLRYANDWAEEYEVERGGRGRARACTLCRKVRVVPPGITIEDEEDWKCDDAPENWFAGPHFLKPAPIVRDARVLHW